MKRRRAFAVAVTLVVMGCGGPRLPLGPTSSSPASPQQTFSIAGVVSDTAFGVLPGSRVEITSGAGTGTIASADDHGHFSMPGAFTAAVTLTASKDGYLPQTLTVSSDHSPDLSGARQAWAAFYLSSGSPAANISGQYTFTLTADAACANLPEPARVRTYTATLTPGTRSNLFFGILSRAQFFRWTATCRNPAQCSWTLNSFSVGAAGDSAGIPISIVEVLGDGTHLLLDAFGRGSIDTTGITASLDGSVVFCPREPILIDQGTWACVGPGAVQCYSARHRLTLVRGESVGGL